MATNNSKSNGTSKPGLGSENMSEQEKHRIQSMGGQSQGKENNPGNFANDRKKAQRAGAEGGSK